MRWFVYVFTFIALSVAFGPRKIDLKEWRRTPMWTEDRTCTVSMNSLPYDGGTFKDVQISEQGRLLLGKRGREPFSRCLNERWGGARPAPH